MIEWYFTSAWVFCAYFMGVTEKDVKDSEWIPAAKHFMYLFIISCFWPIFIAFIFFNVVEKSGEEETANQEHGTNYKMCGQCSHGVHVKCDVNIAKHMCTQCCELVADKEEFMKKLSGSNNECD